MRILMHPRDMGFDRSLRESIAEAVETSLGPVAPRLGRLDLYLTDINGPKGGADKRCRLVAHLASGGPVVVSRTARDAVAAATAAAGRARRLVRSRLQRRVHRRRRAVGA